MKLKLLAILFMAFGVANAQEKFTAYFDFDIDEANHPSATKLSDWIKANPDAEVIKIHAYTDTIGHSAYNTDLSERRANYVLHQLRSNNIAIADDLEFKGLGEYHSASHKPKERRAIIYYRKKEIVSSNPQPDNFYNKIKSAKVVTS